MFTVCLVHRDNKNQCLSSYTGMPRMSKEQRDRAIGMLQANVRQIDVARTFNVTRLTIVRLWRKFDTHGITTDLPRPGRPRKLTAREERYVKLCHVRNRFQTAVMTSRQHFRNRVSRWTVQRRLKSFELKCRRPHKGMILTLRHRRQRLQWAQQRRNTTQRAWNRVLFTDESRFCLSMSDGRARVWRCDGERFNVKCVQEFDRYGGGSVMVWGGIRHNDKTDLVTIPGNLTSQRYCAEVLNREVIPYFQRHGPGLTLMHDNATSHTERVTQHFLTVNNIDVLPWPAKSPDLNPIEHVWDLLNRRVRRRPQQPVTLPELEQALREEWRRIPRMLILRHTSSMRRRVRAVINARGGHNRY